MVDRGPCDTGPTPVKAVQKPTKVSSLLISTEELPT